MAAIYSTSCFLAWVTKKQEEESLRQLTPQDQRLSLPRSYIVSTSEASFAEIANTLSCMVPGTQQGGQSEDKSNEAHVTDETNSNNNFNPNEEGGDASMNDDINPSDEGYDESEGNDEENYQLCIQPESSSPIAAHTRSKTGTVIRPPDRR